MGKTEKAGKERASEQEKSEQEKSEQEERARGRAGKDVKARAGEENYRRNQRLNRNNKACNSNINLHWFILRERCKYRRITKSIYPFRFKNR